MMDDYAGDVEAQRAVMQNRLRLCEKAILIHVDKDGRLTSSYLNCTTLEIMGMTRALQGLTTPQRLFGSDDD
jgi:hypothetical protein